MREQGIYTDIDIDEYHEAEGISSSGMNLILDCPRRFWHEYIRPQSVESFDKKSGEKFMLGRALHMLVLEPQKFYKTFYTMDIEVNLTTKIGKEIYEQAKIEANGRQIIRLKDWKDIEDMANSVLSHSIWKKIQYSEGKVEHSVYWDAGIYNTRLKSRPDFYNDRIIIDVKTTDSIASFAHSMYNYGYYRQAAMQIDGLKAIDGIERHFAFFVVEKKAPYLTACYTLDALALEKGREQYYEAATLYSECLITNNWPGYEEKFQELSLPKWVTKIEEVIE